MSLTVIIGAAITATGLIGVVYCLWVIMAARRKALDNDGMALLLRRITPIHTASFFISVLGLMVVVIGLVLKL